jgi:nitroreductase
LRPNNARASADLWDRGEDMDFETAIYSRRAVREYTAEPVAEPVLRQLIDAAIQAPSAANEQPWVFSVVRDPAVLDRISAAAKAHVLVAPPEGMTPEHLHARLDDPDFQIFYHAPALIVISSATHGRWAAENCALAAENLMLAARAAGLGSCWIGFAQDWLATPEGKTAIGVSQTCIPVAPIIVGHPEYEPGPVARREPDIIWIGG